MNAVTIEINGRYYIQDNRTVGCYRITKNKTLDLHSKPEYDPTPIFSIVLGTEELADLLMEDLYYGEYTGG